VFDYSIQQCGIEIFPYQDHGEEVEEKTRDEGKQEDQDQEPNQEDESGKPHDLEFIHPTSQPKPKFFSRNYFARCLTLLKQIRKPPSIFKSLT
jgi:hypothetical protein